METRIDLDKPIWDQNTFLGRVKYYAWITNPVLSMASTSSLYKAKQLVEDYRFVTLLSALLVPLYFLYR